MDQVSDHAGFEMPASLILAQYAEQKKMEISKLFDSIYQSKIFRRQGSGAPIRLNSHSKSGWAGSVDIIVSKKAAIANASTGCKHPAHLSREMRGIFIFAVWTVTAPIHV